MKPNKVRTTVSVPTVFTCSIVVNALWRGDLIQKNMEHNDIDC